MGAAIYNFLVYLFTNAGMAQMNTDRIVSAGMFNFGMFLANVSMALTLVWFTYKSILMRRTPLVFLLAGSIFLCGVGHLGHVLPFPDSFAQIIEIAGAGLSLFTAWVLFQRRHFILSAIYQFKYIVGLLNTIDRGDDTPKEE